jgi:hypothetical protein
LRGELEQIAERVRISLRGEMEEVAERVRRELRYAVRALDMRMSRDTGRKLRLLTTGFDQHESQMMALHAKLDCLVRASMTASVVSMAISAFPGCGLNFYHFA